MASLTQTAILSRKIIRYTIYAIIAIIIIRFSYKGVVLIYKAIVPPKVPPPTIKFGDLPRLPFPEKYQGQDLTYVLETADGQLPQYGEQVLVYSMPKKSVNLKSLDEAKNKASKLNFNPNGTPVVENVPNVYIFRHPKSASILTMNIITGVFSISYDVNTNPEILNNLPLAPDQAISYVKNYLKSAGLLVSDLDNGVAKAQLLRLESGEFVSAVSLSEANLTKVNLFRKNLGADNDTPSVTPDMPEANVWFLLSGIKGKEIIAAEYNYYPLNEADKGTYPLITSEQAWEKLNKGEGHIINMQKNNNKITIRRVYLAYYDPGKYVPYYQPVFVFEGDNNFCAYVVAIAEEHYLPEEKE